MLINFLHGLVRPKSKNEDLRRHEFILNILLVSAIVLLAVALILIIIVKSGRDFNPENEISAWAVLIAFLIFLILYFFSKKGYFIFSAYIFICIFFALSLYMIYLWGIEVQASLLFFVLVIVLSGVLVSARFAFFTALLSFIALSLGFYFQNKNLYNPNFIWKTIPWGWGEIIVVSIIFGIIATVSWLSNREIERSLIRAKKSEADLKVERDNLEIKVEERTKELKKTQMEKVAQLYRFAEFGRLSSGFFHDLVNPLTALSLNINKINKNRGDFTDETSLHLSRAITATGRMEKFITAVRKQISKQESKNYFSLTEEIIQAIQILSHKARIADVELIFSPLQDIKLYGDSIKFSQAATNLISNAIDAYENKENFYKINKKVEINLSQKDDFIYFTVEDRGAGIHQDNIQKIFEPFYTTKDFEHGTGIGLSLVKNIIEQDFCGSIKVQSKINAGTKFIIKIPVKTKSNLSMSMHDLKNILAAEQRENGSFADSQNSESVFFTALIVSCLNSIKNDEQAGLIRQKAVDFLLSKKDENWTLSKNMLINFCALAAITEYKRELINGAAMAKILMTLISVEKNPGGPYYSRIGGDDQDTDLAVNSSIAYFLSLHNVSLPELDRLIETSIKSGDFVSSFCHSSFIIIYLISKFYKGRERENLINYILNYDKNNRNNPPDGCLSILALFNLGYSAEKLEREMEYLKNCRADELYKPQSLNASTTALNAAFCLAALGGTSIKTGSINAASLSCPHEQEEEEKRIMEKIIEEAEKRFSNLNGEIKIFAMNEIKRTIKGNKDGQMPLMAYYFKKALGDKGRKFSDELIAKLGLANIFFWTAFIIYDDFWDEEGEPKILPTANLYARSFTKFFTSILPPKTGFNDFFRNLMDRLDAANTWETVYCRAKVDGDIINIPDKMPDYGNYDLAYEPASAHILGPLVMLYFLGCREDADEAKNMIAYCRNYLIAMQINDDMHDWKKDLKRGHLSTVVVMLLSDFKNKYPHKKEIDIKKDLDELQKIFWFKTIKNACAIAIKHTDKSRNSLLAMTILEDISPLERIINIAENAAQAALREQKDTADFIREYELKETA